MKKNNCYFDGINFHLFGISRISTSCRDAYPIYYGVQYIHSGPFFLSINNGPVFTGKGPVAFLTSPETRFSYGSQEGTSGKHCYVCFDGERVESYLKKGLFIPAARQKCPYIQITSPNIFLSDMLELVELLQNGKNHEFAVAKLEYILLSMQNQNLQEVYESIHRNELEKLVQEIITHPEKNWDFQAEAAKMNISQKHFIRLFHRNYNIPPVSFVLKQRLYKASGLLEGSRLPIKSVAYECGFNNVFYFSRAFRKYMHFSPESYRMKVLCGSFH